MRTSNHDHLTWIYNRLINVHGENANYDYMLRLKEIIDNARDTQKFRLSSFAESLLPPSWR